MSPIPDGWHTTTVFFNERLNEDPENIRSIYYPTVARRVKIDTVELPVSVGSDTLKTHKGYFTIPRSEKSALNLGQAIPRSE